MRQKYALVMWLGLVLVGAGVVCCADDEGPEAAADVQKLADQAGKKDWAALVKQGEPIGKKHDLLDVMTVFKLRKGEKGGVGVGKTPGVISPDGIDAKLNNLARLVTERDMKHAKDLKRMADIAAAVAGIAAKAPNDKAKETPKDKEKWEKYAKEMHDASRELAKALEGTDAKKVQAAAHKLQGTCTQCHDDYRD